MTKPVDLLHVITGTGTGGAERMLTLVCHELNLRGMRTAVVSLQSEGASATDLRKTGTRVMSLGLAQGGISLKALLQLRGIVDQLQPRVIQGWMYHGNLAATLSLPTSSRRPVLAWNVRQALYDLEGERRLTRWVIRANAVLSKLPSTIIYNSNISRRQHEGLGFDATRSRIIDNGFDLELSKPDMDGAQRFRNRWKLTREAFVFGCVARYHPIKNHKGLIEAYARVYHTYPHARLVLVGEGLSQDNAAIQEVIESCGVASGVILAGPVTDVSGALSAMDVMCLASRAEGFPNVVGEAMACERVCIVTDVGDAARIVGDCGWVVPRDDGVALADAMNLALLTRPEDRARMGVRARRRIADEFSIDRVGSTYMDLYRHLSSIDCQTEAAG